jgi:hypothetical protein
MRYGANKPICYDVRMTAKVFEQAIVEVTNLPDANQEQIGRRLLSHVEKLRSLREELDKGVRSLDAGKGRAFSAEEFIPKKTR